jgi:hypothetical protein
MLKLGFSHLQSDGAQTMQQLRTPLTKTIIGDLNFPKINFWKKCKTKDEKFSFKFIF